MAIVRELITKLGFKVDKRQVSVAESTMAGLKRGAIALAGAFAVGKVATGITGLIKETAALGDQIDKTSAKLGIGASALQELRFAGELTGVTTNTMDMALQRFIRRSAEAAAGTGEAKDALKQMNIQLKDSAGNLRAPEELLGDVANAMQNTSSDGERLRLAFKLFDSEGAALVNTLKGGKVALDEMRNAAQLTGGVMSDELIASTVEFTDTMGTLALVGRGVKNVIATELLPRFTAGAQAIIEWVKANRQLISQNLTGFFSKAADFVENLVDFFVEAAQKVGEFWDSLSPLVKGFAKIGLAAAAALAIFLLPFVGPFLLLATVIGLIIDDFQTWRKGGKSVIGFIINKIDELRDRFPALDSAIRGISAAFIFIKDAVVEAFDFIEDTALNGFASAFESRSDEMLDVANLLAKGMEDLWAATLNAMEGALVATGAFIESAFIATLEAIGAGFVALWDFFVSGGARRAFEAVVVFLGESIEVMTGMLAGFVEATLPQFMGINEIARTVFESIGAIWRATWETAVDLVTTVVTVIAGILGTVVSFWIDIFQGNFQQAFVGVFMNLKVLATEVFGFVGRQLERALGMFGSIGAAVSGLFGGDDDEDDEPARQQQRGAGPPRRRSRPRAQAPLAPFAAPGVPQVAPRSAPITLPAGLVGGARVLAAAGSTGAVPSPVAGPVAAGSNINNVTNRNRASVNVSVQAAPGMDEAKLASMVGAEVQTALGDTMRGAMDDVGLTPEPA